MKLTDLADLCLPALYEAAEAKGHSHHYSLEVIAAEFGEKDRGKIIQVARLLESNGLVNAAVTTGATHVKILGAGVALVENENRLDRLRQFRENQRTAPPFPPYPGPSIKRDEVVGYLVQCHQNNWCESVHQGVDPNEFIIVANESRKIIVQYEARRCYVIAEQFGSQTKMGRAETLSELEQLITKAANATGGQWPAKITRARLSAAAPASNIATIARLVGGSEIQAVFDPYLTNISLDVLGDVLSFGGSISNSVQLLGDASMTRGTTPRLTKTFVSAWFGQRAVTGGEVRLMPPKEHRRFMLLSGGQSLISGMSLNSIDKNEAVRLEPDVEDRAFFASMWAGATPL